MLFDLDAKFGPEHCNVKANLYSESYVFHVLPYRLYRNRVGILRYIQNASC